MESIYTQGLSGGTKTGGGGIPAGVILYGEMSPWVTISFLNGEGGTPILSNEFLDGFTEKVFLTNRNFLVDPVAVFAQNLAKNIRQGSKEIHETKARLHAKTPR